MVDCWKNPFYDTAQEEFYPLEHHPLFLVKSIGSYIDTLLASQNLF